VRFAVLADQGEQLVPLQIIGAGLGRTGTLSLKVALEQLGFSPCYHMVEVWANFPSIAGWLEAANGRPDWERIFAGFQASVDYPGCHFWRELTAAYPKAKVLLTVRDPAEWFESTHATVFSPQMRERAGGSPAKEFLEKTVWGDFGAGIDDRDYMVAAFERHTAEVRRTIPKDRLLVFEVAQGWKPLCEFLDVPIPSVPFPRLNARAEIAAMLAAAGAQGPAAPEDIAAHAKEFIAQSRKR